MSDETKTRENSPGMQIVLSLNHSICETDVVFHQSGHMDGNALHQFIATVDRIFADRLAAAERAKEIAVWEDHAKSICAHCGNNWPAERISNGTYRHFPAANGQQRSWSFPCSCSEYLEKARVLREQG
jgi:hypothetical protein